MKELHDVLPRLPSAATSISQTPSAWSRPADGDRALGPLVRRVHIKDMLVRPGDVRPGRSRRFQRVRVGTRRDPSTAGSRSRLRRARRPWWHETSASPAPFPTFATDAWPRFGAFSYEHAKDEWDRLVADFDRLGLTAVQLGGELSMNVSTIPTPASTVAIPRGAGHRDRRPGRLPGQPRQRRP